MDNGKDVFAKRAVAFMYLAGPLLLTALVFSHTLGDTFVTWDDNVYVTDSKLIRSLSLRNIGHIFSPTTFVAANYQPVTILSFAINYALGKYDPAGYIVTNVMLHLLNTLLVFLFIRKLSRNAPIASLCAMLFGIHPMHVESVAWITGRKDLLYTLFYGAALLRYLRYLGDTGRNRTISYGLLMLLSVLSLLSKSSAVTLPVALLLLDWYLGRKFSARMIIEKLPLVAIAVALGVLSIIGQQTKGAMDQVYHLTLIHRLLIGSYSYMFYGLHFIAPVNLSACYCYPDSLPGSLPLLYWLSPVFCILTAGLLWFLRRSRVFVFGFFFFLLNIFFILHFIPVGKTITADRFSYLAYIGLSFIFAHYAVTAASAGRGLRLAVPAFVLCIAAILSYASWSRCAVWKNDFSLWSDVIEKTPSEVAYLNRGMAWYKIGEIPHAIEDFNQAISYNPSVAESYGDRGNAFAMAGSYDRAIEDYRRAITLDSGFAKAWYDFGRAYYSVKQYDSALYCYSQAIRRDSSNAQAYNSRGIAYCLKHDFKRGIEDLSQAITIDSLYAEAWYNRGLAYSGYGDPIRAQIDFEQACGMNLAKACAQLNSGSSP